MKTISSKLWRLRTLPALLLLAVAVGLGAARAEAVPGQSRGIVMLPFNSTFCSVGGTFDGTYYITHYLASGCNSDQLGIYMPPPTGTGSATLVSTKSVVHSVTGAPVTLDAVDWDASRNLLWGVQGSSPGQAYLIDLGNKTTSGPATATPQFSYSVAGIPLIDGLAWDFTDDTLWISPDIDCFVYHFSAAGTLLGSIQPKNAAGMADCEVSGVAIGAANTLYIGRDGSGEIRRVDKATGNFVSTFTTTNFRVEDLVCAPNLYTDPIAGPIEVILAKDAYGSAYEAFEVETGTCPLAAQPPPECPPDDDNGNGDGDDDNDGLTDRNENLLLTLLSVADSDNDGIVDGNDDSNGNGEDDEDEDDDDECPDEDEDDDGIDDEDEDD